MESLTQKWLRQNSQPYTHKDRVYTDIDSVLARFQSLRPKSDVYTYDDGRTQLLLCIHGLLPISFRQASYNIPIAIWITRDYPRQAPIAYVVPTNDMLVKASKNLDVSGRCKADYLQHWERKSEGCSLAALLEALQDQFSREPPLFTKPRGQPDLSPVASASHPPTLPPKPGVYSSTSTPAPIHIPPLKASSSSTSPPPPPPRPPVYHHTNPTPDRNNYGHGETAPSHPSGPTFTAPPPPPPRPPPPPPPPPAAPTLHAPPPSVSVPPPPETLPRPVPPAPNLLEEEAPDLSQSAYSALSETRPPRPPNPELLHIHAQVHGKLVTEIQSISQALALDAERLRAHQRDLLAGEPAILDEMARLEAVRGVCRTVSDRLRADIERGESNMAEIRRKGDPEVDELVCSTTIVHNQLINLVAEDNAIEDTIYHLHRALNTGKIDLERFLRTIRVLAEEQYMKRALIEKIQAGMPMGMSIG
ncbi:UEV domain-containing protein [Infundibulicybe gibba]|nr:UEV domain-containing protein [Infundibulicybe gibba]